MLKKVIIYSFFILLLIGSILYFTKTQNKWTKYTDKITVLSPALIDIFIDLKLADKVNCYAGPLLNYQKPFLQKARQVGTYNSPILEQIIQCKPSLVITSYNGTPPQIFYALKRQGINTILYKAQTVKDITEFTKKIAKKFNSKVPQKLFDLEQACKKSKIKKEGKLIVSTQPFFIAGKKTFISEAIKCAGFKNIEKGGYKRVSFESLIADKNQKLLILPRTISLQNQNIKKLLSTNTVIIFRDDNIFRPSLNILSSIIKLKKILYKREK